MTSVDGCPMDTTIVGAFEVYPLPVADFSWSPIEGTLMDNTINFTNLSIGGTVFNWNLGDGNTSTSFHVTNTYQDTGSYLVQLIVSNQYGCFRYNRRYSYN